MNTPKSEYEDLNLHVSICHERYQHLNDKLTHVDEQFSKIDRRFDALEERLGGLEAEYKTGQTTIITALIGATATIIAAFVGIITYLA